MASYLLEVVMQRYIALKKEDDSFTLRTDDEYHIKRVMRMIDGDYVEIVYENTVYLCELEDVTKNLKVKIVDVQESTSIVGPRLVLIIPFLKEQKMDLIFQKGTELGVDEFIVVPTERSVVKIEEKKESSKVDRWSRICKEASEQSMRVTIPKVRIEREKEHLENLPGKKLICSTQEKEKTIKNILKNIDICDTINLMIGPEGGFSLGEEIYFEKKGFEKVSLGTSIMRVETVPIFLSSIIRYEYME